jgi:hypothetical protein
VRIHRLIMQSIFSVAARRYHVGTEIARFAAATVRQRWIGQNRCPSAGLWALKRGWRSATTVAVSEDAGDRRRSPRGRRQGWIRIVHYCSQTRNGERANSLKRLAHHTGRFPQLVGPCRLTAATAGLHPIRVIHRRHVQTDEEPSDPRLDYAAPIVAVATVRYWGGRGPRGPKPSGPQIISASNTGSGSERSI